MTPLREERKSRRFRRCEGCRGPIQAGERYARLALPPWCDVNTSDHFWTIAAHLGPEQCAASLRNQEAI